jgi:hypothetical protein
MRIAVLQPVAYHQLHTQQLIGEWLQLQSNFAGIKAEAELALDRENISYWYDCLKELHEIGCDIRIVQGELNKRWRGYA